jgi:hypothetical protein
LMGAPHGGGRHLVMDYLIKMADFSIILCGSLGWLVREANT